MNDSCPKCNAPMGTGEIRTDHSMYLFKKTGWIFGESSNILCNVCPQCGYVEFYAEKPEIFKNNNDNVMKNQKQK